MQTATVSRLAVSQIAEPPAGKLPTAARPLRAVPDPRADSRADSRPRPQQRPQPGPRPGSRSGPRPGSRPAPGLRLTRRGRVVVAAASALLVTVLLGIAAGVAQASSHALPRRVAERNLTQVTVLPGQSLWTVAEAADPDTDPRVVIREIIGLNTLTTTVIFPGERLWVPRE
jgi:hypothetical protein